MAVQTEHSLRLGVEIKKKLKNLTWMSHLMQGKAVWEF